MRMHAWIFESNLMWSSRMMNSFRGLGHTASVESKVPEGTANLAIVNLGDGSVANLVSELKERGIYIVAHAGHKEKELLDLGKGLGVNRLATNSELTHKLPQILEQISV